jgi:hypothetical protein
MHRVGGGRSAGVAGGFNRPMHKASCISSGESFLSASTTSRRFFAGGLSVFGVAAGAGCFVPAVIPVAAVARASPQSRR